MSRGKRVFAEFLGTAGLVIVVVGSGIMAASLSPTNPAIALLANSVATAAGLYVLIQMFQSISGAHFNPAVSFVEWMAKGLSSRALISYWLAQVLGGISGVMISHAMFSLPLLQASTRDRGQFPHLLSEVIATAGLILVIVRTGRNKTASIAVPLYILAAYWCTSSTSFANPAVTLSRSLTDTMTGIQGSNVPGFVGSQFLGAFLAFWVLRGLG